MVLSRPAAVSLRREGGEYLAGHPPHYLVKILNGVRLYPLELAKFIVRPRRPLSCALGVQLRFPLGPVQVPLPDPFPYCLVFKELVEPLPNLFPLPIYR